MKELVGREAAEKWLLFLAVAGPLVGMIVGTVVAAQQRRSAPTIIAGVLIGGLGTVVYVLWRASDLITGLMGLESAANVAVQVVGFAVFGAVIGVVMFRISRLLKGADSG